MFFLLYWYVDISLCHSMVAWLKLSRWICTSIGLELTRKHQYMTRWAHSWQNTQRYLSSLLFSVSCVQAPGQALSGCLLCHDWDVSRCHDVTDPGPYLVSWPLSSVSSLIVRSFLLLPSIFPSQISKLSPLSQSDFVNRILLRLSYLGKVFNWWCGAHYISWSSFEILLQNFDSPCYTNFLMGTFEYPGWAGGLDWLHWQRYLLISSKSETPR